MVLYELTDLGLVVWIVYTHACFSYLCCLFNQIKSENIILLFTRIKYEAYFYILIIVLLCC